MRLIWLPFCFVLACTSLAFEAVGFYRVSYWIDLIGVWLFGSWDDEC